jgi:hypothetical protein
VSNEAAQHMTADDHAIARKGLALQNGQFRRQTREERDAAVDHRALALRMFADAKHRVRHLKCSTECRREMARDALGHALRHRDWK